MFSKEKQAVPLLRPPRYKPASPGIPSAHPPHRPPQQLPHLRRQIAHVGLADLGLRRVQRRRVEVDARVLVEDVDVDGAPGVAERCGGVLLDD